jgi:hypothetical protein
MSSIFPSNITKSARDRSGTAAWTRSKTWIVMPACLSRERSTGLASSRRLGGMPTYVEVIECHRLIGPFRAASIAVVV